MFQEDFRAQIGSLRVRCVRSPEKEGRVLELVRGDSRFMQGHTVCDVRGNLVRVIEHIAGANLLTHVHSLPANHREYFQAYFPAILASVIDSFRAIQLLHEAGLCHGDIRNDHLLVEKATGRFRWIDFDLDQEFADFDIWSAGNILHYIVGRGFVTFRETIKVSSGLKGNLTDDDASVFFPHRVMNLRKVHPHVPSNLNEVLMRFSAGAQVFYDKMSQLVDDLAACVETLRSLPAVPPQPAAG